MPDSTSAPVLEVRDLRKGFAATPVLNGIDLSVKRGEVVFVIGPSGSGKSTLLRCINRLEEPTSGVVLLEGQPTTSLRRDRLRQQVGFVFQSFNLYPHMTALTNVALALRVVRRLRRDEANALAIAALREVGLEDKQASYPSELSGGQQQRVAIARALVLEPKVILFDEPTSALDPELTAEVKNVLLRFRRKGMTMIVVSHELHFAKEIADHVVFMDAGIVVEQGPPDQVLSAPRERRTRTFLGLAA